MNLNLNFAENLKTKSMIQIPSQIETLTSFSDVPDFSFRYQNYTNLKDISVLENVKKVTKLRSCFAFCKSLENISPISDWDVSECSDFGMMFLNCESLKDISSLSNWVVNPDANFSHMFLNSGVEDFSPLKNWFFGKSESEIKNLVK